MQRDRMSEAKGVPLRVLTKGPEEPEPRLDMRGGLGEEAELTRLLKQAVLHWVLDPRSGAWGAVYVSGSMEPKSRGCEQSAPYFPMF